MAPRIHWATREVEAVLRGLPLWAPRDGSIFRRTAAWISLGNVDTAYGGGFCATAQTGENSWLIGVSVEGYPPQATCITSDIIKATVNRQPGLNGIVDCGAPVERGLIVTCRVTGKPGLEVTGWKFTDAAGDSTVETSGAVTWSGIAAASGTVSASVTVDGSPQPDLTTGLTVQPRSWRWTSAHWFFVRGDTRQCSPYVRFTTTDTIALGWNTRREQDLPCRGGYIVPDPSRFPAAGYQTAQVLSGPNAGIYYISSALFQMDQTSGMHREITPQGDTYVLTDANQARDCRRALGLPNGTQVSVNWYTFNSRCKSDSANVAGFHEGIWRHEEYGTGTTRSGHQAQAEDAAADPNNDPVNGLEPLTGRNEGALRNTALNQLLTRDARILFRAGDHNIVKGNWCGRVWRWDAAAGRYVNPQLYQANGQCI